jgi:hypothetical protein
VREFTRGTGMLVCVLLAGNITVVSRAGNDWPQFRGPDRNGPAPSGWFKMWPQSEPKALRTTNVGVGRSATVAPRTRTSRRRAMTLSCVSMSVGNEEGLCT